MSEPVAEKPPAIVATVSGVCVCSRCEQRPRHIYRMVGRCLNCTAEPILMLFRSGDKTLPLECPLCGCITVHAQRRATVDEIPAAALEGEATS